jgi:membrane fusion protein (multidrug efflux system)
MKRIECFSVITGILAALYGCSDNQASDRTASAVIALHYQLAIAKTADIEQTVSLPAQLAAYEQVSIFPKVNGYVKSVAVDIGSHVTEGQVLLTLEAPEIQEQSLQAKEKYLRSKSDYSIDRENYLRLKVASKTAGAISPMDLATSKAKMLSDSSLSNAENDNWQAAEEMTNYLTVRAPFSGVITLRNTHPGDLVSAESKDNVPMLELKQIQHLRLEVDVPESIAARLKQGDTVNFYLSAFPGQKMVAKIARKADDVNVQYRTERIEMDVWNSKETLSPGMYADVMLEAKGNPGDLIVPKSAVVASTDRKYLVAVRNGKAVKIDVTTGIENNDQTEVSGDLKPGEQVIAKANDEIVEGQPVK